MQLYTILFSIAFLCNLAIAQDCQLSINEDLTDPQPLLLTSNHNTIGTDAYHLPIDKSGTIILATGEIVNFNCPGGTVLLNGVDTKKSAIDGSCVANKEFDFEGDKVQFNTVTCSKHSAHTARYTGLSCLDTFKQCEIGFELDDGRFLREIECCFDDVEQHTRYSKYNLSYHIGGYQVGYPRPSFIEGKGFYQLNGLKLDNLYTRNTQRIIINNLLGLPTDSTKYVTASNDYYLARGHLTAKADFIFGAQHRLTFYFINAAPQWQTFNGGNWQSLEDSIQKFGATRSSDLVVYTGSYGKAVLPHETTGKDVELSLYVDENANIAIPVPAIYWKVVYDPESKEGVAFVGVNNPYVANPEAGVICKDVCEELSFLTWKPNDLKSGFSYCCTVDEFRKAVPDLPEFKVNSLFK